MKTWILTASMVRDLEHYVCYCDESPVDLLMSDKYQDEWVTLLDDLYNQFADVEYPEEYDSWDMLEQDEWWDEQYNEWCENVSFEAYESESDERFGILIDERNESN